MTGVPTGNPSLPFLADTSLNLRDVIILDNASSVDVFCNPDLVTNISRSPNRRHLLGNGGSMTACYTADTIRMSGSARRQLPTSLVSAT
jgi:hypothetical protein